VLLLKISFIPAAEFLKYDLKDVVIVFGGFLYGPAAAFAISLTVSFIEMMTICPDGWFGLLMNVVSSCSFACTAAFIYKRKRTLTGAVAGLAAGVLFTTGVMLLWNYMIVPIYRGFPRAVVVPMLIPIFLPFNLIKYGLSAAITMIIYKPLSVALRRWRVLPDFKQTDKTSGEKSKKINTGVILAALFAIITCVMIMLVLAGVI
jgi:riboflavin transporter FmnP